jgi:uncharacterized membrane protein
MSQTQQRLAYIDWMRGLACVLMFQTHCYDSWLSPAARKTPFFLWSQLGGTFPAPLFVFLAGVSFALVTERLRAKGTARNEIARTTVLRGAEIFGLGLLFRVQEFALGYPSAPWTDLLRVDVLNILGLSMMLMGVLCWFVGAAEAPGAPALAGGGASVRLRNIFTALAAAALVALVTPPLWTTHRPRWLPWFLESYVNGVHIFKEPQPWLFPLFPWAAFAFAGLAAGFLLFSEYAKKKQAVVVAALGAAGILAGLLSVFFDRARVRLYAVYDYWHTSPNFFLMRCGLLLVILFLVYAWCRWGLALKGFSPLVQLGKTSLLVYWVHIEFVYGGFSILPKRKCSVAQASAGLLIIFLAMLALSLARTGLKKDRLRAFLARLKNSRAAAGSG